ncbi:4-oxalocrotonate tautomerase DmpI [Syntrophotalea acetylenica]|uniref:4-oxalocrotonate tautomerase DmpI n=1 Tax=Syntrophotalea acetylenica TaxID=29542 RepID=UPI002A36BF62|nr:4-oxalocrotonate tautomerase DmpI [Syntrophotalea acetylenica]MDY0262158.1 4-oxalocrotonate tautomerase DmpI [Syntrophotalea acetylenica]
MTCLRHPHNLFWNRTNFFKEDSMPIITLTISPRSPEVKEQLIARLTEAAAGTTGIPAEKFIVVIDENPIENIGVGGVPLNKLTR